MKGKLKQIIISSATNGFTLEVEYKDTDEKAEAYDTVDESYVFMTKEEISADAAKKMKEKGTVGKFGKATPKKIAAGKAKGGVAKKEAVFAQNMKKTAAKGKKK